MIDVNKSLRISRTKAAEEKLKLINELKIITAPEEIYNLWSEVISRAAHGELHNPDTGSKFNEKENWKQESCMLSWKYFKWLGNLSLQDRERLAKHLLNQSGEKQKFPYPKVTIKSISSVLESCYNTKDWVERRKRKQLVKRELNNIDPTLGLINADGELIHERWKAFKRARNITSASMNVLLERPGETYFAEAKQLKSKNKTYAQISPAVVEFFKVFLNHKNGFELPYAHAEYRTYDVKSNTFSKWKDSAWAPGCAIEIGLAVVDLRELPGVEDAFPDEKSTPYFYSVMAAFEKRGSPLFVEVKRWLFISGSESHRLQTMEFVNSHGAFNSLHVDFANYRPAKFERLGDLSAGRATRKVILTFLQDVDCCNHMEIRPDFFPPESPVYTKPHGYNELEFWMYNTKIQMEFYLWLVRKFYRPGGALLSFFGGGKITYVAVVSHESTRVNLIWLVSSTANVNFMRVLWFFMMVISLGSARSAQVDLIYSQGCQRVRPSKSCVHPSVSVG